MVSQGWGHTWLSSLQRQSAAFPCHGPGLALTLVLQFPGWPLPLTP